MDIVRVPRSNPNHCTKKVVYLPCQKWRRALPDLNNGGVFSWISTVWNIPDKDVQEAAGVDAVMQVKFLWLGVKLMVVLTAFSAVALPIYRVSPGIADTNVKREYDPKTGEVVIEDAVPCIDTVSYLRYNATNMTDLDPKLFTEPELVDLKTEFCVSTKGIWSKDGVNKNNLCYGDPVPQEQCLAVYELVRKRGSPREDKLYISFFFHLSRSMPTANAEDPCRSEGT